MRLTRLVLMLAATLACGAAMAQAPVPVEPEDENSEYVLDRVTDRYTGEWRASWESGDNRFRMRLGSNDVARWFLEEELKASAGLISGYLRLRIRHARLHRYDSRRLDRNTVELEARVWSDNFASAWVTPGAEKATNAVGVGIQNRRATDRYTLIFVEWPDVVRNFTEREAGGEDAITVFSDKPVRLGVSVRESPWPQLDVWCDAEIIPEFVVTEEYTDGRRPRSERVRARSIAARLEYQGPGAREIRLMLEGGYRHEDREQTGLTTAAATVAPSGPSPVGVFAFDNDLYGISADDTMSGWRSTRAWIAPEVRVPLTRRWTVRAGCHLEKRKIDYRVTAGDAPVVTNRYLVPTATALFALDADGAAVAELGWASSHRTREHRSQRDIDDHRIIIGLEYAFSPDRRIRVIETLELDRADRGDYGLHDHAFIQFAADF